MSREFWAEKWDRPELPGWDLEGPHPLFGKVYKELENHKVMLRGAKVLIPGCGRAHDGAAFARNGHPVLAFDLVPQAVSEAKECYREMESLRVEEGDALSEAGFGDKGESFDVVYDRAMLCALPHEDRQKYVDTCHARMNEGGVFSSIAFTGVAKEGGPPFEISVPDLHSYFDKKFTLVFGQQRKDGATDGVIKEEYIMIWRKK